MASSILDRLWKFTGIFAIITGFGGILLAILVSPWFTWTGNALSDLGNPARASSIFFNGGLILAGVFGGI
ncbi:MAG: hypothetical protein ABEI86_04135, partial [Halobacteriaceae archaeon]